MNSYVEALLKDLETSDISDQEKALYEKEIERYIKHRELRLQEKLRKHQGGVLVAFTNESVRGTRIRK